ncbi:MAG: histidine kinase dimerization/phospho-acceptor domain-containing protein [Terriglobales bacterium]
MAAGETLAELCHQLSQPLMAARGSLELALATPPAEADHAEFLQDAMAALDKVIAIAGKIRELGDEG